MRRNRTAGGRQDRRRPPGGGAELTALAERVAAARSLLFVPGNRPDRFEKAVRSGADLVVLDLEDAVAPDHKDVARAAVAEFLGAAATPVVVRINGTDTAWCAEDLAAVRGHDCAVMVPKAHSAAQLAEVSATIGPDVPLIALIETAAGVHACASVCGVGAVVRAAFGSIDLAAELGVDPDAADALQYARSSVVLGSAVAGCAAPLDGVTTDVSGDTALLCDVASAVRLGFGGKLCIHPSQVVTVNESFSPSDAEVQWAQRVLAAASEGHVCVVDGRMVDKPVVDRARRIVSRSSNPAVIGR